MRATVLPPKVRALETRARGELLSARARYRAARRGRRAKEILAAQAALKAARAEMLEAVARVQRATRSAADVVYPQAADLEDIQAALGKDEALVSYTVARRHLFALVVTRAGARIVELEWTGPAKAWNDPATDTDAERARLRAKLVTPLKLRARRVLISPVGDLAYMPFALLMPEKEVTYVPSGTTYRVLRADAIRRGEGVLALGAPDYSGTKLAPLPATREEAMAIGDTVLLGKQATPAGLAAALSRKKRWRAVHLACHGQVHHERPLFSSLALTGGSLSILEVYRRKIPADLVVLSACETAQGELYIVEGVVGFVRAFMLAGAPRVIVSLWKVDDDATRALMTRFYRLWNPPDGSKGLPAATALRRAQAYIRGRGAASGAAKDRGVTAPAGRTKRRRWDHPYYWAAWQLWGLPD